MAGQEKVTSITCSDFLQSNRDYIKRFLTCEDTSQGFGLDWEKFSAWAFEQDGAQLVQNFKKKCEAVEMIDMSDLSTFVPLRNKGVVYQMVTSECAFCEGAKDLSGYEAVIREVNKLLEIGGTFLLVDLLKETYWAPDPNNPRERCPTVFVDLDWVRKALINQGFRIEQFSVRYCGRIPVEIFDAEGFFCLWATKLVDV